MASFSEQTIVTLTKYLTNMSNWLRKAEAFADEKGISHEKVLTHRLIEDQKDLIFQVQSVASTVKMWLVLFGAMEEIMNPDVEKTFAELQARIQLALNYLEKADKAVLDADAAGTQEVVVKSGIGNFVFKDRQTYVSEFMLPYFHFHLTTGYCILRAQGVDLGSADFLNGILHKQEDA